MTQRPKPRKSKLSGLTPAQPAGFLPLMACHSGIQEKNSSIPQTQDSPSNGQTTKHGKSKSGVIFYQFPEDTGRIRRAVLYSSLENKETSLSDFVANAVMKEVANYEKKYNDGRPFTPIYPSAAKQHKK